MSQVSVPRELVALMSALRDGQEPDPSDSSRVIYRFRQPVSVTASFFMKSCFFSKCCLQIFIFLAGPNALLPHCYCCWRFGKQVIFLLLFFLLSSLCFVIVLISEPRSYFHMTDHIYIFSTHHSVVTVFHIGWPIRRSHLYMERYSSKHSLF